MKVPVPDFAFTLLSRWRMWRNTGRMRIDYGGIVLRQEGITLRPLEPADLPRILEVIQDPEIVRFAHFPERWRTRDGARRYIRAMPRLAAAGRRLDLAIESQRPGWLVGCAGLHSFAWSEARVAVGMWVAPEARGSGLGTKVLTMISDWALAELGMGRVEAEPDRENLPSQRMLERAGFVAEGPRLRDNGRRIILYGRAAPGST
jgi:RimJ/RimL family protein N-acetyltransferase